MSMSRMAPFDLTYEISDVPKNFVTTLDLVWLIEGNIEYKMVVPEVVETRDTIEFCIKLGYISQLECLVCYKEVGML